MCEFLPEGIVEEILHRLPLQSIGKCMSVCKSWNVMIKSHSFISSHLQRSILSPPFFLGRYLRIPTNHGYYSICSPYIRYSASVHFTRYSNFVGAINGVVCLSCASKSDIILWNPFIYRQLQLPKQLSTVHRTCLGFGFDSKNNDFKVVTVGYEIGGIMAQLYSLKEDAWRFIDASYIKLDVYFCPEQLIFHGNVYWLVWHGDYTRMEHCILMFNVAEERFNKMELPQQLSALDLSMLAITVIDDCLSLIEYPKYRGNTNCNIWMLRESWSKIYSVSLRKGITRLLGLRGTEVLVLPLHRGEKGPLHSFDLKSQEMKNLGIKSAWLCPSNFTKSLVLLDKESNGMISL